MILRPVQQFQTVCVVLKDISRLVYIEENVKPYNRHSRVVVLSAHSRLLQAKLNQSLSMWFDIHWIMCAMFPHTADASSDWSVCAVCGSSGG